MRFIEVTETPGSNPAIRNFLKNIYLLLIVEKKERKEIEALIKMSFSKFTAEDSNYFIL